MVRRYPTREATLAEEEESAGSAAQVDQLSEPPDVEQADGPLAPVAPELVNVQERMFALFERATAEQREHLVRLLDDVNQAVEGRLEGVADLPFGGPQAQHFVRRAGKLLRILLLPAPGYLFCRPRLSFLPAKAISFCPLKGYTTLCCPLKGYNPSAGHPPVRRYALHWVPLLHFALLPCPPPLPLFPSLPLFPNPFLPLSLPSPFFFPHLLSNLPPSFSQPFTLQTFLSRSNFLLFHHRGPSWWSSQ